MAARALSMSVNALPKSPSPEPEPEAVRTPPTRRGGLRSSNNPQPSSSGSAEPSTSSRQKAPKVRGLSVLKDCRVYVDIRDESGNDTGEYFVNMLKLLGAKVIRFFIQQGTCLIESHPSGHEQCRFDMYSYCLPQWCCRDYQEISVSSCFALSGTVQLTSSIKLIRR